MQGKRMAGFTHRLAVLGCALTLLAGTARAAETVTGKRVLVRDITNIEGIRENPLIGYGLVVGLNGTGDRVQTFFTTQTLANTMRRLGLQVPPQAIRVNNVAAVMVTGSLPAFARPGTKMDITVSSVGDARSLEGGVLLLCALHGPDGQVYAEAQGPLVLGGYSVGAVGNLKQVNHATVGRVPDGAIVERDTAVDLSRMHNFSFMLRDLDFTASKDIADAINAEFGKEIAVPVDSRRIDVDASRAGASSVPDLLSRIQMLPVLVHPKAKVTVNERTGTIVMGGDVKLSPVAVLHGGLAIEITTSLQVSQPNPFSNGETTVVPQTQVNAQDQPVRTLRMTEGANVEELVKGLHAMGASARDIVAILQAIKSAGGLQAELEVL
jgi:flagellar P-ring protein FlgI